MGKLLRMDLHRLHKGAAFKVILILTVIETTLYSFIYWFMLNHSTEGIDLAALGMDFSKMTLPIFVKMTIGMLGDYALYLGIYVVLFSNGDFSSGFIKTIAGQVRSRNQIAVSKFITIFVYTLGYFLFSMCFITIEFMIFFKDTGITDSGEFIRYLVVLFYMYAVLALVIAAAALIARSTLIGMISGIVIATGLLSTILSLINLLINKLGIEFDITEYTITGSIKGVSFDTAAGDLVKPLIVCTVYAIVAIAATLVSYNKRDIV